MSRQQKLADTAQRLQTEVEAFRTKKETIKATYTAAEASAHVPEAVSGISTSMGDAGAAMQRAQDKVAEMQARSGALDELLASGALTDLTSTERRHPGPARQGLGDLVTSTPSWPPSRPRWPRATTERVCPVAPAEGDATAEEA